MSIPLTETEKENLIHFWEAYNRRNNPLLDDPWQPSFGQFPADLELSDPYDKDAQPDAHYYEAAGQERPQAWQEDRYPIVGAMCAFIILGGAVVTLWALFAYMVPWFVRTYMQIAGL